MSRRPRNLNPPGEKVAGATSPSEQHPIGLRLRQLREAARMSQTALAVRTGIRQGHLSELELAARMPTADVVSRYLDGLGVSDDVRQDVLDQLIEHRAEVALLRRLHRTGMRRHQQRYGAMERAATTIHEWADFVVPGLLQTSEYTRAVVRANANPGITDVDGIVAGRAERQTILRERDKRFAFLLSEAALRTRAIPPGVVREQLDAILLTSASSHIDVGVVPLTALPPAYTAFLALDDQVVMIELDTREVRITEPEEVARYLDLFDRLSARAVRGADLADLIRTIAAELET